MAVELGDRSAGLPEPHSRDGATWSLPAAPLVAVMALWQRSGFVDEIGRDHIFPDKRSAIATIVPRLDAGICARCTVKLFDECPR